MAGITITNAEGRPATPREGGATVLSLNAVVTGSHGTGGCVFCAPPTLGTVVTIIEGASALIILCPAHHNALRVVLNKLGDQREI